MVPTRRVLALALLAGLGCSTILAAYTPSPPPKKRTVYSPNGEFAAKIIPGDPGSGRSARARFFAVNERGRLDRLAEFPLLNDLAPVTVLISDDGRWLVTIDEWGSVGPHMVVIYRSTGSVVRSLTLEDLLIDSNPFTPFGSVAYTYSPVQRIDEERGRLVMEIDASYGIEDDEGRPVPSPPLVIRLEDGQLVEPKRRRSRFPRVEIQPVSRQWHCAEGVGEGSVDSARLVGFDTLRQGAVALAPPAYPELAQRAMVTGDVLLEILVAETGAVACVSILKGLPLGVTDAARDAVLDWRFAPLPAPVRTWVTLRYSLVDPTAQALEE